MFSFMSPCLEYGAFRRKSRIIACLLVKEGRGGGGPEDETEEETDVFALERGLIENRAYLNHR